MMKGSVLHVQTVVVQANKKRSRKLVTQEKKFISIIFNLFIVVVICECDHQIVTSRIWEIAIPIAKRRYTNSLQERKYS
jgi:hypothetical protein